MAFCAFSVKHETQKFVEEELGNITMPEMHGKEGSFQYSITDVNIAELNLIADLSFQPTSGLLFEVQNSSIALNFQRRILYWFLRVYDFIATFLTTGMRFVLNQKICPSLKHAALVLVNQLLETIPVRTEVDKYVGIDYSLLSDPVVTGSSLDMHFKGMFYDLHNENDTLVNDAVNLVVREYDRMIYLALSEYFFDTGLYSYFKGGVFRMHVMPKDLEMLLRTTYFGAIMMLNPALMDAPISLELEVTSAPKSTIKTSGATVAVHSGVRVLVLPPGKAPVQLSSMTMESKFIAKVSMKGKRLAIHLDLRRFKIFSTQSALESLALIPLQAPIKTLLQITVVPLINNYTKKGVQIPLPDGIDFIEEVVEYNNVRLQSNFHMKCTDVILKTTDMLTFSF
uniref:Phospholipid transfer protein n=1 Tax=Electrophorus electricus TaxID=8005 RepID=A0A4W4EVM6_ELEEL